MHANNRASYAGMIYSKYTVVIKFCFARLILHGCGTSYYWSDYVTRGTGCGTIHRNCYVRAGDWSDTWHHWSDKRPNEQILYSAIRQPILLLLV